MDVLMTFVPFLVHALLALKKVTTPSHWTTGLGFCHTVLFKEQLSMFLASYAMPSGYLCHQNVFVQCLIYNILLRGIFWVQFNFSSAQHLRYIIDKYLTNHQIRKCRRHINVVGILNTSKVYTVLFQLNFVEIKCKKNNMMRSDAVLSLLSFLNILFKRKKVSSHLHIQRSNF